MYIKKDLAKLIDKITDLEPALEPVLDPIKKKFERQTKNIQDCWNKLFTALNEFPFEDDTKNKIVKALIPKRKVRKKYSFEPPHPNEKIIGTIPEEMADTIRKQDRFLLQMQKMQLEAQMTNNRPLFVELGRKNARLDIQQKKMWFALRDHFNIWNNDSKYFSIREKGPVLVLTEVQKPVPTNIPSLPNGENAPPAGFIQINPETLRQFFRMMNMKPPPGMFPDEEDDENDLG